MNKQKGFSLLEILVAFSILAISLGILLKIFSSGVNTAAISEEYTIAVQIAESLMAKTGIETPLVEGESSGIENDKYRWRVKIEKLPDYETATGLIELMTVQVSVAWEAGNHADRIVDLNSVKTRRRL